MTELSHPVHLTSGWHSAFIPFCAYQTNLNISGKSTALNGTNFPLCSSFVPKVHEGQLCYSIELKMTSSQGKRNELLLLLDYNEDRSLQTSPKNKDNAFSSHQTLNLGTAVESIGGEEAKIQLNFISPYTGFGGGKYVMTDVKRMKVTEDFLEMTLRDKHCKVELYDDCRIRRLLETCECVPWEVSGLLNNQV